MEGNTLNAVMYLFLREAMAQNGWLPLLWTCTEVNI